MNIQKRRPPWLKIKLPSGPNHNDVKQIVNDAHLHTVCQSARCPNLSECWNRRTATFMIMGDECTRNCGFCAVKTAKPLPLDPNEPKRVANAVHALKLKYAVVTCVTRDDLDDGGAAHFAQTISAIKDKNPECKIEVLISDLQGSVKDLKTILNAKPDILNHNIETVPDLYKTVRPQAVYQRSLDLLKNAHEIGAVTKSGIMVGLGETDEQIFSAMQDLLNHNCKRLTIGQYLSPTKNHLPIERFVTPKEFDIYKEKGLEMGFDYIESGPMVRSSYHADEQF